jgi:hypothetical protein
MRIKVLLNLGREWPAFHQDEIQDVADDLGHALVDNHLAIQLPDKAVVVEAVAEPPVVDKFEQMRQHPDHISKKPSTPRKRASRISNETNSQGE